MGTHFEMIVALVDKGVLFVEMLVVLAHALVVNIVDVGTVVADHMHVVMVVVLIVVVAVVQLLVGSLELVCLFVSVPKTVMELVICKFAPFLYF